MNLKILAAAICLSLLSWATPTRAQQRTETLEPTQQLPSRLEQLTPGQIQQFQRLVQQQQPLLYLFLQLQQPQQQPDLQQQAEAQIRQILKQPPSLQQKLFEQQVQGTLRLDKL